MNAATNIDDYPRAVIEKAQRIQLIIFDVDGVLTDGGIIYGEHGEEVKRFNAQDGHGIKMLLRAGLQVALITGRTSAAVTARAMDLGIADVYQRALKKIEAYEDLLSKRGMRDDAVCVVGDDLPDLPLLRRCGFAVVVPDSVAEVRTAADYVTRRTGGNGAVREVCDLILKAQGLWHTATMRYFEQAP